MTNFSKAEKVIDKYRNQKFNYGTGHNCLTMTIECLSAAHDIEFEDLSTIGFSNMKKLMRKYGNSYQSALIAGLEKYGFVVSETPGEYCPVFFEINTTGRPVKSLGLFTYSGLLVYNECGVQIVSLDRVKVLTMWRQKDK